ncbi:ACP phosphodiesterase [Peribacillus sp. NPDC096447]|uniref:ACP phosphodiesterase n=1 Tax=Peribacillus sp. NPDC096447 TaxID=3364394 RepID=UPI003829DE1F
MAVTFVENTLHFLGIYEIKKVIIEGNNQFPDKTDEIIKNGLDEGNKLPIF